MTTSSPGDSEPEVRATGVSAEVPDWSREAMRVGDWNPSRALLASIRAWQKARAATAPTRSRSAGSRSCGIASGASSPAPTSR